MSRILLVEDDPTLRMALEDAFQLEGLAVTSAADGAAASRLLRRETFDLCVLDLMLPLKSGLEILKEERGRGSDLPILMLTARGDEADRVLGLELGADDYVTKPFSLRELIARVRGLLRKERRIAETLRRERGEARRFLVGRAEVDLDAFVLRRDGREEALTPKEAAMLELLHREAGRVVTRARFLNEVWDGGEHVGTRTIDTHVLNLRKKLEDDPAHPVHLHTVHGAGYRLEGSAALPS